MSKRSRRERREHQQERAVASGDVASLRALVEKGPRAAAPAVARALGAPPADPAQAAELDALALGLAAQLRRADDLAPALLVAAAGRRRTPALCMEEALAAFAAGRDEVAAEIAASDAAVGVALGPLLQAVRGEIPASSATTPALRALHAAARAVGHVVRGEPDKARPVIHRIKLDARASVLGDEIAAAADLLQPAHGIEGVTYLLTSPRGSPEVRRLMMGEAALDPALLADPPPELARHPALSVRLLRAQMAAATSPGAIAELVRKAGIDAFDAPDRAAAALYHGFSLLRSEPEAASRSLDRAVQLGADLIESLRGKMLATRSQASEYPEHSPAGHRTAREAASAADRLARALERTPLAGPLAAAAGALAAHYWLAADDARPALAAIARARPLAGGKLVDELDLMEADATGFQDLKAAERRVDALLARSPGYVEAWRMKSALAVAQGDAERGETILIEAAAATKDAELVTEAREIQDERGELVPFQGFIPGAASAGALAGELARATTEDDDPFPLAAAHREALGPAARLAFDAAAIVIAEVYGTSAMVEARLRSAMLAWRSAPRDLARVAAVAIHAELADALPKAALALNDDPAALRAIAEALAVAGEGKLVRRLLPGFAASLTRQEVSLFKTLAAGKHRATIPGVPTPEQAARELDLALAPELSILDLLSEPEGDDEPDFGQSFEITDDTRPGDGVLFGQLLEAFGVPVEKARGIPRAVMVSLERKLLGLANMTSGPGMMLELVNILNESGISPFDGPGPAPRKKR